MEEILAGSVPSSRMPDTIPADIDPHVVKLADLCDGCRDDVRRRRRGAADK